MFMQRNVAYLLLIVMLGLIALGLVMLSSTSAVLAPHGHDRRLQQPAQASASGSALGGIACVFLSRYDYQKLLRCAPWMVGVACVLLVLVPDSAYRRQGQRFAALAAVGGLDLSAFGIRQAGADSFPFVVDGEKSAPCRRVHEGLLLADPLHRADLLLMVKQQDLGTTAIMLAILVAILFCAGHAADLSPAGADRRAWPASWSSRSFNAGTPGRAGWRSCIRIPTTSRDGGKSWQQLQALIALGSGGLCGSRPRQQPPENVLAARGEHRFCFSRSSARNSACG